MKYRPRLADQLVTRRLGSAGAILIEGPRSCGKTATASHHSESSVFLDTDSTARRLLELAPDRVLAGARPRLIDEWQLAPEVWNLVRRAVDISGVKGQFVLTGSATPADDGIRHSGAGRFSRVRMSTMTLPEYTGRPAAVSLAKVLSAEPAEVDDDGLGLGDIARQVCLGGWPSMIGATESDLSEFAQDYLDQVSRVDIAQLGPAHDGPTRVDPVRVRGLLAAVARASAAETALGTLAADAGGYAGGGSPLHPDTVRRYLDVLQRIFIVETQPAWSVSLRSRARIRSSPKWHVADVSLAVAALGASSNSLIRDPETLGFLFESFVYHHLWLYAQQLRGRVFHYRDSNGLEADAVIDLPDGRWAACEVKLSPNSVDMAANSLLKLAATVDTSVRGEPAALMVITGWGAGYRRPDGVQVVPLSALGA